MNKHTKTLLSIKGKAKNERIALSPKYIEQNQFGV